MPSYKVKKVKCSICKTVIPPALIRVYKCKCNNHYCGDHRNALDHECTYNWTEDWQNKQRAGTNKN